ncbi:MAG: hypothetical protein KGJ19_03315 [Betaproteobacteria bacterium]|nr:hypothetical protein [Betaproteobacteria bacterium]
MLPIIIFLLPILGSGYAYADPPSWAPAHGYRDKHHRDNDERDHDKRDRDERDDHEDEDQRPRHEAAKTAYVAPYGIDRGTCNREQIGQVLGGITGAAIGSTVGQGKGNTAAIIGGSIIGVIVGGSIGRSMDRVDQGCVGQILEHGPDGKRVEWTDRDGRTRYQVTPDKPFMDNQGRNCRKYLTNAETNGNFRKTYNTSCRDANGTWQLIN